MAASPGGEGRAKLAGFSVAVLLLSGLDLALGAYFLRPSVVFTSEPLRGADYDTHFGQVVRFLRAMQEFGRSWSYDPSVLAGHLAGTLFDADNKGWELFTWLLVRAGLAPGLAFNLFVVFAFCALPVSLLTSARLFGLGRGASLFAMLLGTLVWFFDSQTHLAWWVGMTAFAFACQLCLPTLALFHRFTVAPRAAHGLGCAVALALCLLVHPYAFFVLVAPMLTICAARRRAFRRSHSVGVVLIATFAVVSNLWWLGPALRFWHYLLDSAFYAQARPIAALHDLLGLVADPDDTGLFMRSGVRFTVLAAAALSLELWRRARDERFLPFAVGIGLLLAETYFGSVLHATAQIQPYRFVVPAALLSVIPAAELPGLLAERLSGRVPKLAFAALAVVALPASMLIGREVLLYFPDALPVWSAEARRATLIESTGRPSEPDLRHRGAAPGDETVMRWLRAHHDGLGRVLVGPSMLGERLSWQAPELELLGGLRERNEMHADAHLFRRFPRGDAPEAELAGYLETYAVRWVVISPHASRPARYEKLLRIRALLPDGVIAETTTPVSWFAENSGTLRASMNRIDVFGTEPARDVVLRYHYLETLDCRPDCRLEREPLQHDRVGFIRVSVPHPADFVIENRY